MVLMTVEHPGKMVANEIVKCLKILTLHLPFGTLVVWSGGRAEGLVGVVGNEAFIDKQFE